MRSVLGLFQAATDGACGVDRTQRIVLWNRAAESLMGYDASDVLGRHCFEIFRGSDECDRPVCQRGCPIFSMVSGMKSAPTQVLQVHGCNGDGLWLSVSTIAIPSQWNVEAVLVHLFRDVSYLKSCAKAVDNLLADVVRSDSASNSDLAVTRDKSRSVVCLTRREQEVLRLLATGRSTKEIASALFVSPSTVRNHVHNILAKLDAHSRLQAVTTAMRFGLL